MADVHNLNAARADKAQDNTLLSPADCLEDALQEVRSGVRVCDKLVVLTLDTTGDGYGMGYYASNIKASEIIALCEATKARMLRLMGIIP
jgi:hypothetical protein